MKSHSPIYKSRCPMSLRFWTWSKPETGVRKNSF
ncbi:hypothetical protein COLO4_32097 [Corchorus olitorius]|uniref:Uncharacterized protein n=1 Tax=Corchorus olitorius TaxID=93759 RepID=A0A1R3H1V9_9ROSI|nr:hypothetical protein COLO4_32097 [Corchorus olitorius]